MLKNESRRTKVPANWIGPQMRHWRMARGWSQQECAVKLQLQGLDYSREVLARIECQLHCVKDWAIPCIAETLGVDIRQLFFSLAISIPAKDQHIFPANFSQVVMKSSQPASKKLAN